MFHKVFVTTCQDWSLKRKMVSYIYIYLIRAVIWDCVGSANRLVSSSNGSYLLKLALLSIFVL